MTNSVKLSVVHKELLPSFEEKIVNVPTVDEAFKVDCEANTDVLIPNTINNDNDSDKRCLHKFFPLNI